MDVNVATIRVTEDDRVLRTTILKGINLSFPADIPFNLIKIGFPDEVTSFDWNNCVTTLKNKQSFKQWCIMKNGNDLYVGASTYSMFAAIGAAALCEFEELESIERS